MTKRPATVRCIGIILDGNRRWARERGLPTLLGHRQGFENLKDAARSVRDAGIPHLFVWAFSTENWNRSEEEVTYLMDLFREVADNTADELTKENIRIRFAGQRERFAPDLQKLMTDAEQKSKDNTALTLWIGLSYGGRAEILDAAQTLQKAGTPITDETLRGAMWTAEMPDPDIIIRTGGERRLSGFLTWSGIYAELFFIPTQWPAFSKEDLEKILAEYAERDRRMGK
jgi:undecaprenyl diphosphate synthase